MASRETTSTDVVEVFAVNEKFLFGPNEEQCFEEVLAAAWFDRNKTRYPRPLRSKSVELCYETLMVVAYARKLMQQNQETYLENAWGDPHISAEVYIQLKAMQIENTAAQMALPPPAFNTTDSSLDEFVHVRRRRKVVFDSSSSSSNDDEDDDGSDGGAVAKENEQTLPEVTARRQDLTAVQEDEEKEESEGSPPPLRRKGCSIIDVSNCCLPLEEVNQPAPVSSPDCATQLFSPGQVRQLLLGMQQARGVMHPVKEEEDGRTSSTTSNFVEAVDPWCPRFTEAFWSKVAPRTCALSSYYSLRSSSTPRKVFHFGRYGYSVEGRLGRGRFGTVYLARLLQTSTSGDDNALPLDTSTVGCVPELLQQRDREKQQGILRVVKVETPGFPLEFYYMHEARRRVSAAFRAGKLPVDVRPSICPALGLAHSQGHFTCLLMPFYAVGLLEWLNYTSPPPSKPGKCRQERTIEPLGGRTKSLRPKVPPTDPPQALSRVEKELLAVYMSMELLWLLEGLHHHARIIHGDIKPDNFRLNGHFPLLEEEEDEGDEREESREDFMGSLISGRCTRVLVLVDFGLCVDMARFPPETCLRIDDTRCSKRPFPCIEMRTGRPWTYQLDLFNVAGVIYTLIFKRYMEVEFANGLWLPKSLPRSDRNYRAMTVWREVFGALLNVRSCAVEDYPSLARLRTHCEAFLRTHASAYNLAAERANAILTSLMRRQQLT